MFKINVCEDRAGAMVGLQETSLINHLLVRLYDKKILGRGKLKVPWRWHMAALIKYVKIGSRYDFSPDGTRRQAITQTNDGSLKIGPQE